VSPKPPARARPTKKVLRTFLRQAGKNRGAESCAEIPDIESLSRVRPLQAPYAKGPPGSPAFALPVLKMCSARTPPRKGASPQPSNGIPTASCRSHLRTRGPCCHVRLGHRLARILHWLSATGQAAVSRVGREHLRAPAKGASCGRRGRPQVALGPAEDTDDCEHDPDTDSILGGPYVVSPFSELVESPGCVATAENLRYVTTGITRSRDKPRRTPRCFPTALPVPACASGSRAGRLARPRRRDSARPSPSLPGDRQTASWSVCPRNR